MTSSAPFHIVAVADYLRQKTKQSPVKVRDRAGDDYVALVGAGWEIQFSYHQDKGHFGCRIYHENQAAPLTINSYADEGVLKEAIHVYVDFIESHFTIVEDVKKAAWADAREYAATVCTMDEPGDLPSRNQVKEAAIGWLDENVDTDDPKRYVEIYADAWFQEAQRLTD